LSQTDRKRYSKNCRYGCGKLIEWDTEKQAYIDPATGKKHECNLVPKFYPASQLYEENEIGDKLCNFIEVLNKDYFKTQKIKVERIYL
jgi:hypothetical protein